MMFGKHNSSTVDNNWKEATNLQILESRPLQHRTDLEPMASSTAVNKKKHNPPQSVTRKEFSHPQFSLVSLTTPQKTEASSFHSNWKNEISRKQHSN